MNSLRIVFRLLHKLVPQLTKNYEIIFSGLAAIVFCIRRSFATAKQHVFPLGCGAPNSDQAQAVVFLVFKCIFLTYNKSSQYIYNNIVFPHTV